MSKIAEVAEGIYLIDPEKKGDFCFSYLISGKKPALVDPGPTAQVEIILEAMERDLKFRPESLSYIIPTHVHVDHSGGAGYLAGKLPKTKVVAHERGKRHLADPSRLIEASKKAFGPNFQNELGPISPIPEDRLITVQDGEKLNLGNRDLEVIYSPGHASHHLCFYESLSKGIFCGDALGMYLPGVETVIPIAPDGFDLEPALQSVSKIRGFDPQLLFYPHYGVGREVNRLLQLQEEELRCYRDIILEALQANEDEEQIIRRLEAHIRDSISTRLNYDRKDINLAITVSGYRGYFKKKGLI
ncbi:MAG: MBL fold metallo-hydrolase [Dehalococcoidia bacterium]|nr:MBL fold metallo-hydrolase [Dehalococcoidia bacterium]